MQRRKKQILGILGLAAVFAMTAIAYALPTPEAHAETSASADVLVKVTVPELESRVAILSPQNGEILNSQADGSNIVKTKLDYQHVSKVKLNTTCRNADGNITANVDSESDTSANLIGQLDVDTNLGQLDGTSYCRITATGLDEDGNNAIQDIVEFTFRSISVVIADEPDKNGNPVAEITMSSDVQKIMLQVYDKQGNPIFVGENGENEAIWIPASEFTALDNGEFVINYSLPMKEYGAPTGWYDLVVVGYNSSDTIISMNVTEFYYDLAKANVPNTGSIFQSLNISRADYLITGLVAFGAIAGFAIFLIVRNKRRN